jgi:hypothetical protein
MTSLVLRDLGTRVLNTKCECTFRLLGVLFQALRSGFFFQFYDINSNISLSQARIRVNSQKACRQLYIKPLKNYPKTKEFVEMWQKVSPNKFFPSINRTILTPKKGIKKIN